MPRKKTLKAPKTAPAPKRTFDARPDTLDFRDRMFEPSLIEVPTAIPPEDFLRHKVPVLDQGVEGACTGFGLATVAHYLLTRRRVVPDATPVSPRMLYEMARRYDEWPGEDYSGSSARGAMKGWYKHGLCSADAWPYEAPPVTPGKPAKPAKPVNGAPPAVVVSQGLTAARTADAVRRPLGAYLRVNHKDLVAMHCALAEVGIVYATATVHEGWPSTGRDGVIAWPSALIGGHAFAIVGYDSEGFWVQNSWGTGWGQGGLGRVCYDDWLANGTDVWVARLGAPVALRQTSSSAIAHSAAAGESAGYAYADLRPHIVSLGNEGKLKPGGDYGSSADEVRQIFREDIPAAMKNWKGDKHILLYAHGGLVDERSAVQRLADYRAAMMGAQVYPVTFIWHSDYWSTVTNILEDATRRRRPEGLLDKAKDFMLDRLDDTLEIVARAASGKAAWDEMKENALAAAQPGSGARLALDELALLAKKLDFKLHVVGHSAGSIFHAPLVRLLTSKGKIASGYLKGETGYGLPIDSCTLWAPACTVELFKQAYLPAIDARTVARFALFALNDKAEQDDNCARLYNKSLLYLVARAFERSAFGAGTPLAGMERWLRADPQLMALFDGRNGDLVLAPNNEPTGSPAASKARHHGDFDDDRDTVNATLARVLDLASLAPGQTQATGLTFHSSSSSLADRRVAIDNKSRPGG